MKRHRAAALAAACLLISACGSSGASLWAGGATPATATSTPTTATSTVPGSVPASVGASKTPPSLPPPAMRTPTPSPSASSRAQACTGTADNKAFLAEAASHLTFDVYCAVLPSGWYMSSGSYTQPSGGKVLLVYKNSSTGEIDLSEGNFCSSSCNPWINSLGPASFDGTSTTLYLVTNAPKYAIYLHPATANAYTMTSVGVTSTDFKAWSAALYKVPKS
jgi:hypothetical protein